METIAMSKKKKDEVEKKKEVKKPPYYVAKGKAITSKKGILSEGDEVKAEYFGKKEAGEETLASLVDSGHVKKR
jgi:hypothetical protein